jgi:hypothetical protein
MAKIKKAQKGTTMSAKDSMNMYANRYDSLSAEASKKMMRGKSPDKDLKAAKEARAKESGIAKRLYGTTPGQTFKKGGKVSKGKKGVKAAVKGMKKKATMSKAASPMMKRGGKISKKK